MTIEQGNVIDFIGVNDEEKFISLTISDHLEWDDTNEKLLLLQGKINSYLKFIESEQIYEQYPNEKSLDVHIVLLSLHLPNEEGLIFLKSVKPLIEKTGISFRWDMESES